MQFSQLKMKSSACENMTKEQERYFIEYANGIGKMAKKKEKTRLKISSFQGTQQDCKFPSHLNSWMYCNVCNSKLLAGL